jgi:hypothetical protein
MSRGPHSQSTISKRQRMRQQLMTKSMTVMGMYDISAHRLSEEIGYSVGRLNAYLRGQYPRPGKQYDEAIRALDELIAAGGDDRTKQQLPASPKPGDVLHLTEPGGAVLYQPRSAKRGSVLPFMIGFVSGAGIFAAISVAAGVI